MIPTFRRCLFVVLILLALGCGNRGSESQGQGVSQQGRPGVPLSALLEAGIDPAPGADTLAVLDRLQPPRRLETEPRENRHVPGQVDTLRTYVYRGLKFTVYDVTDDPKEIMKSITVTDSTYETEEGLRVGTSREQVRALKGPPDRVQEDSLVYHLGTTTPNTLHVSLTNNRVSQLEWNFYVD